ncbi:MAG TPA: response regulator [Planctomycetota bacterium]
MPSSHVFFCDRDLARSATLRRRLRDRGVRVTATSAVRVLLERTRDASPDAVVLGDLSAQVDLETLAGMLRSGRRDLPIALMEGAGQAADLNLAVPESTDALESWLDAPAAARPRPLVLCVDDDVPYLDSLARLLRRQGYRVAAFDNPEEALAAIPLKRPDLAILDVRMVGMSGFQMVEEIREVYGAALPILLLSGLDSDRSLAQGIRLGATAYLTKPCPPACVLSAVDSLTKGRAS